MTYYTERGVRQHVIKCLDPAGAITAAERRTMLGALRREDQELTEAPAPEAATGSTAPTVIGLGLDMAYSCNPYG